MSGVLMTLAITSGSLFIVSIVVFAALSARALRRGADFEAEMRAASFGFHLRMRPRQTHED